MVNLLKDKNVMILLGILFLFVITIPKIIFPDLDHGDEYSDASTLMSGNNFVKFGFIRCRYVPVFEPHLDKPTGGYTHAPPLSDIMNGLLRKIFKTDSLRFFREISLLFSLLNLLVWYLFVKKFTNSYILSILAAIFYFANPSFIYGADSLYQNAYADFLRVLIFLVFLIVINSSERKRIVFLLSLWALVLVSSLITYEYVIYFSLFFILYKYFFRTSENPISWKIVAILLVAPAFGFLLNFLKNTWYFGSFSTAFNDLKNIFLMRSFGSYELTSKLNLLTWWRYAIIRNFSPTFLFSFPLILLSIFFILILCPSLSADCKRRVKSLLSLFALLTICGISWYVFFPSHTVAHAFVGFLPRHLLPAVSIAFTIFFYTVFSFIKENMHQPYLGYFKKLWVFLIIVVVSCGILKSQLPITPSRIKAEKDFLVFKRCLLNLKNISADKETIGVNYFRYPFIRYYTHRHTITAFDKKSLENLPALPHYFILIPYQNQKTQDLFQFLKEKYAPLFQCKSFRFPSIFFKLKS